MCADSTTDTKLDRNGQKKEKKRKLCVTCHMLHVTCHMSRVTCHLSLRPTATATDPPSANSPTMHSRLV